MLHQLTLLHANIPPPCTFHSSRIPLNTRFPSQRQSPLSSHPNPSKRQSELSRPNLFDATPLIFPHLRLCNKHCGQKATPHFALTQPRRRALLYALPRHEVVGNCQGIFQPSASQSLWALVRKKNPNLIFCLNPRLL